MDEDQTYKMTKYYTGIIGVTEYSPVLSVNGPEDKIAYSLYKNEEYHLYKANAADFPRFEVNSNEVDMTASQLPPLDRRGQTAKIVSENLESTPMAASSQFDRENYQPRFKLEMVSSRGVGVGANQFGTSFAGGVSFMFSDILKKNILTTTLRINGQIEDIGGQVAYINRANRWHWGAAFSHIPYRSGGGFVKQTDTTIQDVENPVNVVQLVRRVFEDQLTVFTQYPFSVNHRLEGGLTYSRYGYQLDSINNFYTPGGIKFAEQEYDISQRDARFIGSGYAAYVGDNSQMGQTSPLMGNRYRFEVQRYFSDINLWSISADYRKYWFAKPFSFAVRGMFYGRYGDDSETLYPLYLGNNYFVRGYTVNDLRNSECSGEDCLSPNQLVGKKIAVANAEIRLPFTGADRLALITSGFLFSDLVLFADGGIAWDDLNNVEFQEDPQEGGRIPVFSAGVALRINLFGYFILEPYLAFPFQRNNVTTAFNLYISPGGW